MMDEGETRGTPAEPLSTPGVSLAIDPEEQFATRAAWLYFVAGLTQAQIGKKLGLNRTRVNRLLAQARDLGLVQINITGRLASCVELEEKLVQRYGLEEAIVVPTPPDQELIPQVIATAAAAALSVRLKDGMSVGVGWGRTLRLSIQSVPRRQLGRLSIVSLLGGLTRGSAMNPHETASHLADLVGAQCYYVAAPALTDTQSTRDLLMAQPMLHEIFERGARVDLAFLSVGELTPTCTMTRVGLVTRAEVDDLLKVGAVGDISAHWIDRDGRLVDHPLNQRVVALSPEKLKDIPCVMIASGGKTKVPGLRGVLRGGMCNVIITDEQTATSILAMEDT
ncbi:sugar-binding transcriptional regulator [Aestuariivirga sp.]|uniref:sugar-binding transcriptional regulator n=1 Tax=Aestuariivirga sp. TaxID=2650926 RepID=UPI003017666A